MKEKTALKNIEVSTMLGNTFLIMPRKASYMLFHKEEFARQTGRLVVALITHANYSDSYKWWSGVHYKCFKGEYIGNYKELARLTDLKKSIIKKAINELKKNKIIEVKKIRHGCRIILTGYQQFLQELKYVPQQPQGAATPPSPGSFCTGLPGADLLEIARKENQSPVNLPQR